jgi:hypothetical protein
VGSTRRENRDGKSGYDLGAVLTGCDGGIDEPPREGFFASPSLPFIGKTGSYIRLGRRPSRAPIGLGRSSAPAVWWKRSVHRKGRAAISFCIHLDKWIYFLDVFVGIKFSVIVYDDDAGRLQY